jgi:hypothetical protein|tara:strand:+ start:630 stop:1049 length:420 start_codon:yes stop_codon:yes gene_type:complete
MVETSTTRARSSHRAPSPSSSSEKEKEAAMNDDARWTLRQLESLRARPEVISRAVASQERACVDVTLATDDARRFLALEREMTRDLAGMEEASARASALARACAREMREARALVERSRRKLIAAGFVDEGELVPFDPDA